MSTIASVRWTRGTTGVIRSSSAASAMRRRTLPERRYRTFVGGSRWPVVAAQATLAMRLPSGRVFGQSKQDGNERSAGGGLRTGDQPAAVRAAHSAADKLVADLVRRFDVTVTRGPAVPWPASGVQPIESIRIAPPDSDQAPLTITTTSFPGLYLNVGAWQHIALPACGCDACDEQIDSAVDDLVKYCTALAEGKLTERINIFRRVLEHSWDGDCWSRSGTLALSPKRASELRASRFSRRRTGTGVPGR